MTTPLNNPLLQNVMPAEGASDTNPQNPVDTQKHSCAFGSVAVRMNAPTPAPANDPGSLFDLYGRRKYLNAVERERFINAAATFEARIYALCLMLHFTGCRISEALAVCPMHLDAHENVVILQTLKQRKRGVFRMMPLPPTLVALLHHLAGDEDAPIIGWHRTTAWEKITAVMARAGVQGPQATPRGTRHGFGVAAVSAGVPITLLQRWLGHARLETTSIYLAVTGPEERDYAAKLWCRSDFIAPHHTRKEAA